MAEREQARVAASHLTSPALIVGSSFGAVVALELIRTTPQLGAVLIEPPMGASDDAPAAPAAFLPLRSLRMASYGMNDVKNGMKILVNNQPAVIIDTEYVKPGKGQAFTRVKYRLIKDGRTQEVTMKSTDSLDAADVVDTDMNFMYSDGEYWHFMDPESFEQVQATKAGMCGAEKWLKGFSYAGLAIAVVAGVAGVFIVKRRLAKAAEKLEGEEVTTA